MPLKSLRPLWGGRNCKDSSVTSRGIAKSCLQSGRICNGAPVAARSDLSVAELRSMISASLYALKEIP